MKSPSITVMFVLNVEGGNVILACFGYFRYFRQLRHVGCDPQHCSLTNLQQ